MSVREIVYPQYGAEAGEGGDVRLRFNLPGSTLGPVYVSLDAADARRLMALISAVLPQVPACATGDPLRGRLRKETAA